MKLIGRFALLLFVVLTLDVIWFARSFLPEEPSAAQIAKTDLVVVLTGGQGRLREAIELLKLGKGERLLISGVDPRSKLDGLLRANRIEDVSEDIKSRISMGPFAKTTVENAVEIREAIQTYTARSVLVVTSNYHMTRALRLLRFELARAEKAGIMKPGSVEIFAYPVAGPNFDSANWWSHPTSWEIFLSEYMKSLPLRWVDLSMFSTPEQPSAADSK